MLTNQLPGNGKVLIKFSMKELTEMAEAAESMSYNSRSEFIRDACRRLVHQARMQQHYSKEAV